MDVGKARDPQWLNFILPEKRKLALPFLGVEPEEFVANRVG